VGAPKTDEGTENGHVRFGELQADGIVANDCNWHKADVQEQLVACLLSGVKRTFPAAVMPPLGNGRQQKQHFQNGW